jgi:glycosyltransferase involved in cell wall biosynthesis
MLERHPFLQGCTGLLPNCLDPLYAERPVLPATVWNKHWRLDTSRTYLLTLARLQATEQAKGYDQVIAALPALVKKYPNLGYILAGKWDTAEHTRIRQLADAYGVANRVLMPGYVAPESLPALYALANVFVMPSSKEGFGIVYLEAAWQGCRVVAANMGGAPEALLQGKLGSLCPANDAEALQQHLLDALQAGPLPQEMIEKNRQLIQENFGFAAMVQRVAARLAELRSM